jgi:microcin C transport system substrate-binding protein
MGSGPYRLDASQPGRSVSYVRDPNYWGRELPVNKGRYNFDRIVYEYYRDELVQFEGFKAGEYDFRTEHVAKNWATGYDFPAVQSGLVTLQEIPHGNSSGMQGFVFNTRKSIFSDVRVREALGYAFDFEWSNRTLFHNAYTRSTSYFSNTELAASGVPTPAERRLLDPFRQILPDQLFTQPFALPETDGSGNIRHNLIQASRLLKQAGWEIKQNRLIRTADNTPMEFEILLVQPMFERIVLPFTQNLEILGIKATVRVVDAAQYLKRIEHFDFDMIVSSFGQSLSPGNEQRSYWGSENAPIQGSGNLAGIEDPVVDAMIDEIIAAPDREALVSAARALDRVLLWGHYVIPHYHINTWRMAYWSKFKQPQTAPLYDLGLMNWWVDPEAEKALNQQLSRSTSREQRSE